jgi:hypothetical protein
MTPTEQAAWQAGWIAGNNAGLKASDAYRNIAADTIRTIREEAFAEGRQAGRDDAIRVIADKLGPLAVNLLRAPGLYTASGERHALIPRQPTLGEIVADMLGRADLLGQTVQRMARRSHAQFVTDEIATYEHHYRLINNELRRPAGYEYHGGPVDWDTGLPVAQVGRLELEAGVAA